MKTIATFALIGLAFGFEDHELYQAGVHRAGEGGRGHHRNTTSNTHRYPPHKPSGPNSHPLPKKIEPKNKPSGPSGPSGPMPQRPDTPYPYGPNPPYPCYGCPIPGPYPNPLPYYDGSIPPYFDVPNPRPYFPPNFPDLNVNPVDFGIYNVPVNDPRWNSTYIGQNKSTTRQPKNLLPKQQQIGFVVTESKDINAHRPIKSQVPVKSKKPIQADDDNEFFVDEDFEFFADEDNEFFADEDNELFAAEDNALFDLQKLLADASKTVGDVKQKPRNYGELLNDAINIAKDIKRKDDFEDSNFMRPNFNTARPFLGK